MNKKIPNFNDYAKFYDLAYKNKNYKKEIDFVKKKLNIEKSSTILDLGCGTFRHSIYLAQKVKKITGIDQSKKMLKIARHRINKIKLDKKKIVLKNESIIDFKCNEKFDYAYSLFDVVSYITKDNDLNYFFLNLYNHLKPGSLLYLDYWYKPAIFHLKIKNIKSIYESNLFKIIREKKQILDKKKKIVNVSMIFNIYNKINKKTFNFIEKHPMRFFDNSEIEKFSQKYFYLSQHLSGYSDSKPSKNKWQASTILIRK
jgi:SAM-dependent methyltransferase